MPLTAFVNEHPARELTTAEWQGLDLRPQPDGSWHLLHNDKSYRIEATDIDAAAKTLTVVVEGTPYVVRLENDLDRMMAKMSGGGTGKAKANNLKAPMPGLIRSISVVEGAHVKKGETVLILEAMKMENSIKAPADGVVRRIAVAAGDAVDKGQVLIEMG